MTKKSQNQEKVDNRKVKCPYCEEMLLRREAIRHTNGRYYHNNCYEEATKDSREYAELIETVCRIFGMKKPNGQILRQLKLYREDPELNCTNKGMELTLRYYYDLLGNKPRDGDGVGIIPLNYHKAKEQYVKQMDINKSFENINKSKKKEVYVTPSKKRVRKQFDINSL